MSYIQLDDIVPAGDDLSRVLAQKAIFDTLVNGHVVTFTIDSGGTNYVVGDILTLTTGVSIFDAKAVVTAESSGVITEVRMRSGGVYTTLPNAATTGHATTTNSALGSGATLNLTVEGPYEAVPNTGGSGYAVGDVITVLGGTGGTTDPTFVVLTVSGGAVLTTAPLALGDRTTAVDTSASTTGGGGSGLTVDYNQVGWIPIATNYVDNETEFECWFRNTNLSGSAAICGLKTFFDDTPYIQIRVGDGYSGTETFDTQSGTWLNGGGDKKWVMIPTNNSGTFSLFMYYSGRVLNFVFTDDSSYELGIMGLFVPITDAPSTTFPRPYFASGTTCSKNRTITSPYESNTTTPENSHAGIFHHGNSDQLGSPDSSPHRCTNPIGQWGVFMNGSSTGYKMWPWMVGQSNRAAPILPPVVGSEINYPTTALDSTALSEENFNTGFFRNNFTTDGTGGVSPIGGSGQLHFMVPPVIISDFSDGAKYHGTLEGLAYINGRGLDDEDRVLDTAGRRWVVLPDTNTNSRGAQFAMLEG